MNVLAWLMLSLLEKTAAHLARLAEKLPDDDSTDMARRQRVRRFLSNPRISPRLFVQVFVTLLRPLVQAWKAVLTPVIEALRAASWTQGKEIHVVADAVPSLRRPSAREFASPRGRLSAVVLRIAPRPNLPNGSG